MVPKTGFFSLLNFSLFWGDDGDGDSLDGRETGLVSDPDPDGLGALARGDGGVRVGEDELAVGARGHGGRVRVRVSKGGGG